MQFNKGYGQVSTTNQYRVMKVFLKQIVHFFFDKINAQLQKYSQQFFFTKQKFLGAKKFQKFQLEVQLRSYIFNKCYQ